jgi:hypothetical protein
VVGRKGQYCWGHQQPKDIKEVITDNEGAWSIEGPSGVGKGTVEGILAVITFLTGTHYTKPPQFIIYEPGYCPYAPIAVPQVCWEKGIIHVAGNGETHVLPKLLDRMDREHAIPEPIWGPDVNNEELLNKQKKFVDPINEEQRNLGLRETNFQELYQSVFKNNRVVTKQLRDFTVPVGTP